MRRASQRRDLGPSRGTSERGSISIAAAGVMVVVLVLALACADLAHVLSSISRAQTAADAAALAAAQQLVVPQSGSSPEDAAREYAGRNGASLVSCRCDVGGDEATVLVRVAVGRLFLFGSDRSVEAQARAETDRSGSAPSAGSDGD